METVCAGCTNLKESLEMQNEWILDVLNDLRNFAATNELPELYVALEKSEIVAREELGKQVSQQVSLIHACFSEGADFIGPTKRHS